MNSNHVNIVNLNTVKDIDNWLKNDGNVYVGRPRNKIATKSKGKNPFTIKDHYSRQKVIKLFFHHVRSTKYLADSVGELRGKVLGCWCAPNSCHAEVLHQLAGNRVVYQSHPRNKKLIMVKKGKNGQPQQPEQGHHDSAEEIRLLKETIAKLEERVDALESFKIVSETVTESLRKELDRLDQYGRRSNVVIRNVEKPAGKESLEQIQEKVNDVVVNQLKSPNLANDIDKFHRIGRARTHGGKTYQNIVVKFRSHKSRYALYKKRKDLKNNIKINAHLTNHRAKVLHTSVDHIKDTAGVEFTFSNTHGDLYVRLTAPDDEGTVDFEFNTIDELDQILRDKGLLVGDEEEEE